MWGLSAIIPINAPWFDLQLDALNSCLNKNLVHQVGDQTKVILRCTVNQPSRFATLNKQDRYTNTNKQEFSASSWRSNQGYTRMHGQPTIKTINARLHEVCTRVRNVLLL